MGKRIIGIVLVLLCGARVASAQTTTTQTVHHTTNVTVVLPSSLSVGGQYYDASVGGVEDFMAVLHSEDPALWAQLEADVARLRTRRNWSIGSAITAGVVGGGLFFGSFFAGPTHNDYGVEIREANYPMMAVGGGILVVGTIAAQILWPRRGDMMDFVNKHNRLRPNSPMQLQLGMTAGPGNVACAATITF